MKIKIDTGSWKNLDLSTKNYELNNIKDGKHEISLMAMDLAGNEVVKNVNFTVDTVAPTLYFSNPSNNTWLNKNTVNISWVCKDSWGISVIKIRIDNNNWKELQVNDRSYKVNIPEGKHTIEILAIDMANNTAITKEVIGIDYENPLAKIKLSGNYILIGASDNLSGIKSVIYSIDGNKWENYGGKINTGNLSAGTHNISVIVEDYAGNKEYANKTFEIKSMPYHPSYGNNNFILLLALIGIIIALGIAMLLMILHYREEIGRLNNIISRERGGEMETKQQDVENKEIKETQNNTP